MSPNGGAVGGKTPGKKAGGARGQPPPNRQGEGAMTGTAEAQGVTASAPKLVPGGASGTQPKAAGTAVAKGGSTVIAADPSAAGSLADPDALSAAQNPFSPEGAPDDETPPKPLRHPT